MMSGSLSCQLFQLFHQCTDLCSCSDDDDECENQQGKCDDDDSDFEDEEDDEIRYGKRP